MSSSNAIFSASNIFGVVNVAGDYVSLSDFSCGTKGAYVYAKSRSTNPIGVGIKLFGNAAIQNEDTSYSIATLYPGDITIIPIDPAVSSVSAITTSGDECVLEYSFSDRGTPFGSNAIWMNNNDATWKYAIFDSNLGEAKGSIDTGISTSSWDIWNYYIVQDKGYLFTMTDGSGNWKYWTIDSKGAFHEGVTLEGGDFNTYQDNIDSVLILDYVIGTTKYVASFDGDVVYTHSLDQYDYYNSYFNGQTGYNTKDGSFTYYALHPLVSTVDLILFNKDKKYILGTYPSPAYLTTLTKPIGNFIAVIEHFHNGSSRVTGLKVFNTNGTLLQNVQYTNPSLIISAFDYYGNGKFWMVLSDSYYWYAITYDENTNILLGGDLNWKYDSFNHTNWSHSFETLNVYNNELLSFNPESILFSFYSPYTEGHVYGNYFYYQDYVTLAYVFEGMTQPGEVVLGNGSDNGSMPTKYIYEINQQATKSRITITYTTDPASGDLRALTLTPTGVVDDQIAANVGDFNNFDSAQFGNDYLYYFFYNGLNPSTSPIGKLVIHGINTGKPNNILDIVNYTMDGDSIYYNYYNNNFFIGDYLTGNIWYFNTATKKMTLWRNVPVGFIESVGGYNNLFNLSIRWFPSNASIQTGVIPEKLAFLGVKPPFNAAINDVTIFDGGRITNSVVLPNNGSVSDYFSYGMGNGVFYETTNDKIVFCYYDGNDPYEPGDPNTDQVYHFIIYDQNLNLIKRTDLPFIQDNNEFDYNYEFQRYTGVVGNRIMSIFYNASPYGDNTYTFVMMTPEGVIERYTFPDWYDYYVNDSTFNN